MTDPVPGPWQRRFALALLVAWMAAIFGGSSTTPPEALTGLDLPDYLLHGAEYAVLGFLAARYLRLRTRRRDLLTLVAIPAAFAFLYGLTDELHQSFVPGRDPDLADAVADLAGGAAGGVAYLGLMLWWRRRRAAVATFAVAVALAALAPDLPAAPVDDTLAPATASIRPERVQAEAAFLASDALRGRGAPSADLDRAARYIAERFRRIGLEPGAGNGSWFQPVPMRFRRDSGRSLVRILDGGRARELTGEDVAVSRSSPDGLGAGPLVFAGYGISAPDLGRDDYAGIDVAGKVVLVFDGGPGRADAKSVFRKTRDRRVLVQLGLPGKAAVAASHGAVGLLVVAGARRGTVDRIRLADGTVREGRLTEVEGGYRLAEPGPRRLPVLLARVEKVVLADGTVVKLRRGERDDLDLPAAEVERFFEAERVSQVERGVVPLPASDLGSGFLPGGAPPTGPLPVLRISARAARDLLAGSGRADLRELEEDVESGAASFDVEGRQAVVRVATRIDEETTKNVIGRLPGREREDGFVLLTAHYDHLGVSRDGEIMNGADDNASGTATLIAVARAFAEVGAAPRRPVLFIALTAEERGLIGSREFVRHPPVPLDAILAEVNMDMVGRGTADELNVFVGPLGTDLGTVLRDAAERAGIRPTMQVVGPPDGKLPPPTGREKLNLPVPRTRANLFGRSDHTTFYRKGIPAAFLFGGIHADYHRPTDTAEKLSGEKMARTARLGLRAAWHLAEEGLAPARDEKPGSGK